MHDMTFGHPFDKLTVQTTPEGHTAETSVAVQVCKTRGHATSTPPRKESLSTERTLLICFGFRSKRRTPFATSSLEGRSPTGC
jgi:hypothetical protein